MRKTGQRQGLKVVGKKGLVLASNGFLPTEAFKFFQLLFIAGTRKENLNNGLTMLKITIHMGAKRKQGGFMRGLRFHEKEGN